MFAALRIGHHFSKERQAMPPAEVGLVWLTFRYPLTDHRQFDILKSDPGWRGSNAIRSIETPRVHHAARRRGGDVAARCAFAAAAYASDRRAVDIATAATAR